MKKLLITACSLFVCMTYQAAESDVEVQTMINKLIVIAEELLVDHGEFFPFGGAMKTNSEIVTLSGIDGINDEQPSANEVIENLQTSLQIGAQNANYKATAILSNVHVVPPGKTEQTTAVAIAADHVTGLSLLLVFPYKIDDGAVTFGDVFAKGGENKIFAK